MSAGVVMYTACCMGQKRQIISIVRASVRDVDPVATPVARIPYRWLVSWGTFFLVPKILFLLRLAVNAAGPFIYRQSWTSLRNVYL